MSAQPQILVIEDDKDIRESLLDLLNDEGLSAQGAAHGEDAIRTLEKGLPVDLILLDLRMPVMDGTAFLAWLQAQERLRQIPVIAMSATQKDLPENGATLCLRKPIDVEELLEAVGRLLAQRG